MRNVFLIALAFCLVTACSTDEMSNTEPVDANALLLEAKAAYSKALLTTVDENGQIAKTVTTAKIEQLATLERNIYDLECEYFDCPQDPIGPIGPIKPIKPIRPLNRCFLNFPITGFPQTQFSNWWGTGGIIVGLDICAFTLDFTKTGNIELADGSILYAGPTTIAPGLTYDGSIGLERFGACLTAPNSYLASIKIDYRAPNGGGQGENLIFDAYTGCGTTNSILVENANGITYEINTGTSVPRMISPTSGLRIDIVKITFQ